MLKRLDPFLLCLIGAVTLASFFPAPAILQPRLSLLISVLITIMFFLHGAKLERRALLESIRDWKLQGGTLLVTFAFFPLLGSAVWAFFQKFLPSYPMSQPLWMGILFLCCLPSTVQSSIALTSIAKGNVPASICAATASNILGIFFTPFLCSLLLHHEAGGSSGLETLISISRELLLPFIVGQLLQNKIKPFVDRHKFLLSLSDRGSIVIMVYAAFSEAILQGLWHIISLTSLFSLLVIDSLILFITLAFSYFLGFFLAKDKASMISLQFCSSKKALSTGVLMASVIFPSGAGILILPLMIYHQIQLFICTLLAQFYAKRIE